MHNHYCDVAGHSWICDGFARRLCRDNTEPSICICLTHKIPMEEGDHSLCPVELLACPDHFEQALRAATAPDEHDDPKLPNYPEDDAIAAAQMLILIKLLYDEGDPVGSALADAALDKATQLLKESGLLYLFITRAVMGMGS